MKILFIFSLIIGFNVHAASIQKWVDENGQVHYGDQPPMQTRSKSISVDQAPSSPGPALPRLKGSEKPKTTASSEQTEQPAQTVPADQAEAACEKARSDLSVIKRSSRIRTTDDEGNSRYMTSDEIQERRESTEADIENFCN